MSSGKQVEVLIDHQTPELGRSMLRPLAAVASGAGCSVTISDRYQGRSPVLVLYGYGRGGHRKLVQRHLATERGSRVVIWDRGYWGRDRTDSSFRLSIDRYHPSADLLRFAPENGRAIPPLHSVGDPAGFILLCSCLPKSASFGGAKMGKVLEQLGKLKQVFPEREIRYRPKPGRAAVLSGIPISSEPEIQEAMRGAALVVTQQSNVGVDAAICGVPAVVTGGVAACFFSSSIERGSMRGRSEEERRAFLRRVAWFNWRPIEAEAAWQFVSRVCGVS